jgi:hypothetical protein
VLLITDTSVKVAAAGNTVNSSDSSTTSNMNMMTTKTLTRNDSGADQTVKVWNYMNKKKDMSENALNLCDEIFQEVQTVKGKYDNMFVVSTDDLQKMVDVMEKFIQLGKTGEGVCGSPSTQAPRVLVAP